MLSKLFSAGPISALATFLAFAAAQETRPAPALFVTPDQLSAVSILPNPPAPGSARALEEIAELHRIQETRTKEDVAHAQADDREESIFAFADVLGPSFRRASLPLTALLSDHVKANESPLVNPAKEYFARPRPFNVDATITPVCKKSDNKADYSYPSGHGATGYLEALVLAQIVPEKRAAILARADNYAYSREICGVHYPSDEVASKAIAYAMIGLMFNNPRFQAELRQATVETRQLLALPRL